ncbi:MAG: tetratricopeptide repeat protein, partial [Chloroflexi bacterium]|nr:tetratricopeptide repeat protein [Chloroflexota bacterium]
PEQIHLLIAGRAIPDSPAFTHLAITEQIAGIDEDYLRFTPEEVQALLQQRHNLEMPRLAAEALTANTEGWITAILMSTYSMWRGMTASAAQARQSESVYGFLAEEVLDQQPPPMKIFLLESSVLPDMDVEICNEVLERTDSEYFLKQAEERHLFVNTVGEEFRAYQYHNLFRDFLSDKLRSQDPKRLAAIRKRAANWYYTQGMIEAAVTFYVMAGCVEQATQIIEAQAVKMYATGRYATLNHWAEHLGQDISNAPQLNLMLAIANTDRGQLDAGEERLKLAKIGFGRNANSHGCLEVQIHQSFVWYRRGKFEQGLELANDGLQKAAELKRDDLAGRIKETMGLCLFRLEKLPEAEKQLREFAEIVERLQKNYDLASALNNLSLVLNAQGKSEEAQRTQQRALELWREQNAASPLAHILNNIGWNLHLLGQHESALATYGEALEWARRGGNMRAEIGILNGQSEIWIDLGDYELAYTLANLAIQKSERVAEAAIKAYLYRGIARLDRLHKKWDAALEWIEQAKSLLAKNTVGSANVESLRGMIWVERGEIEKGHAILVRACDDLERSHSLIDLAQASLFRACAEFRRGNKGDAIQTLTRALAASQESGYDQMLIGEVNQTRDLFEAFVDHPEIGSRLKALITRAEGTKAILKKVRQTESTQPAMNKKTRKLNIEVRALGQSCVYKNGAEITKAMWRSQKTRELFLFLIDRAPLSRETILEIFWGDKSTAQAVNNLNQTLFWLRRALGQEAVILENNECRLSPDIIITCDAALFESTAKAALTMPQGDLRRLEPLAAAIEIYSGEYLADVAVEWAAERRESLSELFINVACAYTDELMGLTRYAETREVLNKALKIERLRDDLHRRMLICLHKMGRRHEVVNHYLKYCDLYRTELGLPPAPEIQTLYSRLI